MLSPKNKRNLVRIVSFGVVCAFFALVFTLIEKGILGELTAYPATGNPYNFQNAISVTTFSSLILGLIFGSIEIFFLEKRFLKVSFLVKLIGKSAFYIFLISFFFYVITIVNSSLTMDLPVWDPDVLKTGTLYFGNSLYLATLLYAGGIIIILLFLFEVNDYLGQGIILNYITGKYHQPREEKRIFMFLDMKSSTSIAENLGHIKYFEFLKLYYADMTDSIEHFSGKVYQYAGDEIVVTWNRLNGTKNNNCINCFFNLKATFENLEQKYLQKFGVSPKFKASMHYGIITTGEIGILKKEILFTGDVLNTTARIEKMCNEQNEELIISSPLFEILKPNSKFDFKDLGNHKLRGKNQEISLFAVATN